MKSYWGSISSLPPPNHRVEICHGQGRRIIIITNISTNIITTLIITTIIAIFISRVLMLRDRRKAAGVDRQPRLWLQQTKCLCQNFKLVARWFFGQIVLIRSYGCVAKRWSIYWIAWIFPVRASSDISALCLDLSWPPYGIFPGLPSVLGA